MYSAASGSPSGGYRPLIPEVATHRKKYPTGPSGPPAPLFAMTPECPHPAQRPRTFVYEPQFPREYPPQGEPRPSVHPQIENARRPNRSIRGEAHASPGVDCDYSNNRNAQGWRRRPYSRQPHFPHPYTFPGSPNPTRSVRIARNCSWPPFSQTAYHPAH